MMQLVIKIPEDVYKRTKFYKEFRDLNDCVITIKALDNGTPLEKHDEEIIKETVESICGKPPYTEVLDKIKAEIDAHRKTIRNMADIDDWYAGRLGGHDCDIEIIDKYRKEQE